MHNRNPRRASTVYTQHNSEYFTKNPSWHVEDSPWKAEQIARMLDRHRLFPSSVVEVGCGAGEVLNQLHNSLPGVSSLVGYDVSNDAIRIAKQKEREGLKFECGDYLDTTAFVDLLLVVDVLEHVEDYLGFLRSCRRRAKYTMFHIPLDISVQGILRNTLMDTRKSVGHLHYFVKDTALASLVETGYTVIDFDYTTAAIDLPKDTLRSRGAVLPRRLMFTLNRDLAARFLGGFSLLVLAK